MKGGDQETGEPSFPATKAMEERGQSGSPATKAMEETGESGSTATGKMYKQFKDLDHHLDMSGDLREVVRGIAAEIDSATRRMYSDLRFAYHSRPVTEFLHVSEMASNHRVKLREIFAKLTAALSKFPPVLYSRYHGDWSSETQRVVSFLAFLHWLETGTLLLHSKAEQDLGLNSLDCGLDIEDYLIGICLMSDKLLRYAVNQVRAGDYDCPWKALKFLTDVHASFNLMNLKNDFLRKKYDEMDSDLRRLEQVNYDVEIRGLPTREPMDNHELLAASSFLPPKS